MPRRPRMYLPTLAYHLVQRGNNRNPCFFDAAGRKYERTASLWDGRHKSSPVDTQTQLLKCYRYIELNPVRAKITDSPENYLWSSYAANALGEDSTMLSPHAEYNGRGATREDCCVAYRGIVRECLDDRDLQGINKAIHDCRPLGDDRFRQKIEDNLGIPIGQQRRGRPRRRNTEMVNN